MNVEGKVYTAISVSCASWEEVCKAKKIAEQNGLEFDGVRERYEGEYEIEFIKRKELTKRALKNFGF